MPTRNDFNPKVVQAVEDGILARGGVRDERNRQIKMLSFFPHKKDKAGEHCTYYMDSCSATDFSGGKESLFLLKDLCKWLGIDYADKKWGGLFADGRNPKTGGRTIEAPVRAPDPPRSKKDFYYESRYDVVQRWADNLANSRPDLVQYLTKRGVTPLLQKRFSLGYTSDLIRGFGERRGRWITIPNFGYLPNDDEGLVSIEVRNDPINPVEFTDKDVKYMTTGSLTLYNVPLMEKKFLEDQEGDFNTAILLESKFDALAVNGILQTTCATAVPKTGFNKSHARMLAWVPNLLVIYDNDPDNKGFALVERVLEYFPHANYFCFTHVKDFGDAYQADPFWTINMIRRLRKLVGRYGQDLNKVLGDTYHQRVPLGEL